MSGYLSSTLRYILRIVFCVLFKMARSRFEFLPGSWRLWVLGTSSCLAQPAVVSFSKHLESTAFIGHVSILSKDNSLRLSWPVI
jgi:hypothetical protein